MQINSIKIFNSLRSRPMMGCAAVAAILCFLPQSARAAPVGGVVASGSAIISSTGSVTTVSQASDRAIVDWQSFDLSQDETARFFVPNSTSATLNRISGAATVISGSVESNGVVYFSNPNGLVFDATSRVSANGFLATTGTISNFDFMNRGEFAAAAHNTVTLNGAISASAITALAGTVTVGGNLSAGSGKILVSSTNLTTIGVAAVIAADCAAVPAGATGGNAGSVKIWSDNHTDFLGSITAIGGAGSGDGGFVEVSGKNTLNFRGKVSTLAPHGKTGTLLLDPATIEIGSGSVAGVSYISTSLLATALSTNDVIIDANAATTSGISPEPGLGNSGSGLITVSADVVATSGTSSLSLVGSQIILKANLTVKGNLSLIATRGSVWQDPTKVITAPSVSGKGNDGFTLLGLNLIDQLGAGDIAKSISNTGSGGVMIRNDKAVTLMGYSSFGGGKGGVTLITTGKDVTVESNGITVTGAFLRFDLGSAGHLLGAVQSLSAGPHINALGLAVIVTSAVTGNSASVRLENGTFTFVHDLRSTVTGATIIDNSTSSTTATIGWGSGLGLVVGTEDAVGIPYNGGGLKLYSSGGISSVTNQGVVYGGTVEIRGISTGGAKDLRYIEGTGIAVTIPTTPAGLTAATGGSGFSGALMLVGSGAGVTSGGDTAGVLIKSNLTTGSGGDLTLFQTGSSTGVGILVAGAAVKAGGNLALYQSGGASLDGVKVTQASLAAAGAMNLTQAGDVGTSSGSGVVILSSSLTAVRVLTLTQAGLASVNGIAVTSSSLTAGVSLGLLQNGTIPSGSSSSSGIALTATDGLTSTAVSLAAGVGNIVTLKTNGQKLSLNTADHFAITNGKLRIDLGVGAMVSSAGNFSLQALETDVYFTGAASGHSATIAVGKGSFTRVIDNHAITARTVITSSTIFATPSSGGLIVSGSVSNRLNRIGVVYGGKVEVQSIAANSNAASLGYIEGSGVGFTTGASSFGGSLTVVSTGSGYLSTGAEAAALSLDTIGILLSSNITTGTTNDGLSDLSLVELGSDHSNGIHATPGVQLEAGGDITMVQTGVADNTALNLIGTSLLPLILRAGGDIYLNQAGIARLKGIEIADASLTAKGSVTVIQSGTVVNESAITISNATVMADGAITFSQIGSSGAIGIRAEATSFTAGGDLTLQQLGSLAVKPESRGIILSPTSTADPANPQRYRGVTLTAGRQNSVTLRTQNQALELLKASDFQVSGARLRIDLGSGILTSTSDTLTTPPTPLVLNAAGMAVYYTGAKTGNLGAIAVGSGSFSFVNDLRTVTDTVTLDKDTLDTTPTIGWGSGISFTAGATTAGVTAYSGGGLTVSTSGADTTVKNQGVIYGGIVQLNGLGTVTGTGAGTATNLTYIEGRGIGVLTLASSFSGSVALVSNGSGYVFNGIYGSAMLGITVEVDLMVGTGNDGRSDLLLQQKGAVQGYGVGISASITAGRDVAIFSDGTSLTRALNIQNSTVTSGRDLTLVSNGKFGVGSSSYGISLQSANLAAVGRVSLLQTAALGTDAIGIALLLSANPVAITAKQGIAIKTASANMMLFRSSGVGTIASFTSPRVRIDLGNGAIVSKDSNGTAPSFGIDAFGAAVFYTSATSGNSATITVSSGSFTFVNDRRTVQNPSGIFSLDQNSTAASSWGSGLGTLTSGTASASGITVVGADINGQGLVYDRTVTITGISATAAARELRYIEGANINLNSIVGNGNGNGFSGSLTLVTGQFGTVRFNANLTTVGRLEVFAGEMALASTITTSGGDLMLDLGATGVFDNGSGDGFTLNTSGQNLSILAGRIRNTAATNPIFSIGNGNLVLGGGLALATKSRSDTNPSFTGSTYITSAADEARFNDEGVVYYFTSDTGTALATAKAAAGVSAKAFWLDASALGQGNLGFKRVSSYRDSFTSNGLASRASGDYYWAVSGVDYPNPTSYDTVFALKSQREVHFYNLVNPTISAANTAWLARSSAFKFDGASNSFNSGLTIGSTGAITQASGVSGNSNSLIISGGNLTITGSSEITLTGNINQISGFGALRSTGSITITNSHATSLNGDLTTTGSGATISLDNTTYNLTLGSNVTSSGGDLTINLRTASFIAGNYSLSTSNRNLHLKTDLVSATNNDQTVLALGSGSLTLSGTALATVSSGGTVSYYDYHPTAANNQGSTVLASDPNAAGTQWIFYGTAGVVAPGLVYMNSSTLLAGQFVKKVTAESISKAGLEAATTGNIKFKAAIPTLDRYQPIALAAGHAISLQNLGTAQNPFTLGNSLPVASSIVLSGGNYFTGTLTLNTTGSITQDGGATLTMTSGSFNVTNSSSISLTSGINLSSLGTISASTSIEITNEAGLTLTGALTTTGSPGGITIRTNNGGSIRLSGAVSMSGGLLTLTSAGGVSQDAGATLVATTGILIVSAGTSAGIVLTNPGNRIATVRNLSSAGSIALSTDVALSLGGGNLTATGASSTITITSAGLTLSSNINSRP